MTLTADKIDPKLDLMFERIVDVPKELVWKAWTTPEMLKKWFTPAPWTTVDCELDLRSGGAFKTVMRSPEGEEFPHNGCYLEVCENERLVWTNAFEADFRPIVSPEQGTECTEFLFTAMILFESHGSGTKYTAIVLHATEEACAKHAAMGFEDGWGKALDQLVELVKVQV